MVSDVVPREIKFQSDYILVTYLHTKRMMSDEVDSLAKLCIDRPEMLWSSSSSYYYYYNTKSK